MQPEELQYQLVIGNKLVGEQRLRIEQERNYWLIKTQTSYAHHLLGTGRKEQVSRVRPKSLTSAYYFESTETGGRKQATFETLFDRKTGLVTVRQDDLFGEMYVNRISGDRPQEDGEDE